MRPNPVSTLCLYSCNSYTCWPEPRSYVTLSPAPQWLPHGRTRRSASAIPAYSAIFSAHVEDNLSPTCAHPYTFIHYPHASLTEVYKPFIHPTFILPFLTPGHYYPTPCYRLQVYNLYPSMHNIRVIYITPLSPTKRKRSHEWSNKW